LARDVNSGSGEVNIVQTRRPYYNALLSTQNEQTSIVQLFCFVLFFYNTRVSFSISCTLFRLSSTASYSVQGFSVALISALANYFARIVKECACRAWDGEGISDTS